MNPAFAANILPPNTIALNSAGGRSIIFIQYKYFAAGEKINFFTKSSQS
jgi:hypothetical protein